ncbi:Lon protease [Desulfosarcina ovata subsp. sediminis]|uniref:Lon protease n=1 Tax=Desulfosarcina ovata subsp. sediminis TaxID=885957 RepID=A0A5K8A0M1_9BACT|nr:endopeptidase La [Desulfosarcina ovata]BBO86063.1 Lon protease [Desulfosarcina ovata subsp. sediminis]
MNAHKKAPACSELPKIPDEIGILPLNHMVAYPYMALPLAVARPGLMRLIEDAVNDGCLIGLITSKETGVDVSMPWQIYEVGTVARIHRAVKTPSGHFHVMVQGVERFRVKVWRRTEPYLTALIQISPETREEGVELDALKRRLQILAQEVVTLLPGTPDDVGTLLESIDDPRYLAYMVAANSRIKIPTSQKILEIDNLNEKLRALITLLSREKEVLSLGRKIQAEAQEEMAKNQRDYFLRQQLKAIQKELGEERHTNDEIAEYEEKLKTAGLPAEALEEATRELQRMGTMHPSSAEHSVIKTYLDWILALPWQTLSDDRMDIPHAREILDEDHWDLEDVKNRLIEYLAVKKLVHERQPALDAGNLPEGIPATGTLLCFVGPPGVGKTSLGQSIARALERQFTRMSLGGMRDEAEIRGHRRTYIGAMPGRIIQAIKRTGTRNPVFMLDEIDKVGSDWRGDPSSALLEVLDPAQNHAFRDHYLDVDFDLSQVMFITTANQLETILPPLRDRMEVIPLDGYTEQEKLNIATRYLVPRQIRANGLRREEIRFTPMALTTIIRDYTREAGVRNLERQIGAICRKTAVSITTGTHQTAQITPESVGTLLKKPLFDSERSETIDMPGIVTGLSVTAYGGEIIFIEATRMSGKGELTITGHLGDVMMESARIAHSYVRAKAPALGIDTEGFRKNDIHLHVPAGATPKDGPSAGLAMILAMASIYTGQAVPSDIGFTGEVTLRGRVLPVGGIKTKVLAAHRAGLKQVVLPRRNARDLDDLPEAVRREITARLVDRVEEALSIALPEGEATDDGDGQPISATR